MRNTPEKPERSGGIDFLPIVTWVLLAIAAISAGKMGAEIFGDVLDDQIADGIAEGTAQGIEKGMEEGLRKGLYEPLLAAEIEGMRQGVRDALADFVPKSDEQITDEVLAEHPDILRGIEDAKRKNQATRGAATSQP